MRTIYIEGFSGLSGNMFLSAFCQLLDNYDLLLDLPQKLHLPDGKIEIRGIEKNGINCKYIEVIDLNREAAHKESKAHNHNHSHNHHHGHDHAGHRHLSDIQKLIDNAHITDGAKRIAHEIFLLIGKAESKIHNIPLDKIHFHEISGVDSIIDIVGNAVLIDSLNIDKVYCTPICTGYGAVSTQHGILPVPAPATIELLQGIPIYSGDDEGEKITPTGAAILKFLNPDFKRKPFITKNVAYGPGKKDYGQANVVRISIVEEVDKSSSEQFIQMETSIDDMSPEYLGADFQEGLMEAGAIDFGISQQLMKKGRYGFLLCMVLLKKDLDKVSTYIFENTSTIGVRYYPIERNELRRKSEKIATELGEIKVKFSMTPKNNIKIKPEYEEIKNIGSKLCLTPFQVLANLEYKPFKTHFMKKVFTILLFAIGMQVLSAHPGGQHSHDTLLGEFAWLVVPVLVVLVFGLYCANKYSKNKAR